MKFIIKKILIRLSIFFLFCAVKAQDNSDSSIPPPADDDESVCGRMSPPIIRIEVFVRSNNGDYVNNLTHKNFEVFQKEKLRDIEVFKFDELKNQYIIGFYQEDLEQDLQSEVKEQDIKVRLKLSKEKESIFEKISITIRKIYLLEEN